MSEWQWEIENNDGYGPCYIVGPREVGSEVPNLIAQVIGDSAEAEDNARKMVAAPEMADILREIAQLPQLLDGTDRSAVVITADLRQRIGEVLLRLNGFDEWPY